MVTKATPKTIKKPKAPAKAKITAKSTTKRAPQRQVKVAKSKRDATRRTTNWPLLIVSAAVLLAAGAVLITMRNNSGKALDARATADGFFKALSNCDVPKLQQYFPANFSDQTTNQAFLSQCTVGEVAAFYVKDLAGTTQSVTAGVTTKVANFEYRLDDNGNQTNDVVQLTWNSKSQVWQVARVVSSDSSN